MDQRIIAVAGGSGFIGRTIVNRLAGNSELRVRVLSRDPDKARLKVATAGAVEFVAADVTDSASLAEALTGADTLINAVQFQGYPVENPRRGLTFERIDYGGTVALLAAAAKTRIGHFIYISGAATDENSSQPAFRAKGRAERAIKESGLAYTIFRPSLVYGRGDRVMTMLANALGFAPVMAVPGSGKQRSQPVCVDDIAACVALAISGRGRNGVYEIGGPDVFTFDELVQLVMEITGHQRVIIHLPEGMLKFAGTAAEILPWALFSRDAAAFLLADTVCDTRPLIEEFGITLTPAREGLAYLKK